MSLATSSLATMSPGTMSLGIMSLWTISLGTIVLRYNVPRNNVPQHNCSSRQLFNGIIFLATIIPPFLYKWSFAKRTVVRMTKIKGTEDHRLLQMIIRMIRPPPFLWKWSFAKRAIRLPKLKEWRSTDCCKILIYIDVEVHR